MTTGRLLEHEFIRPERRGQRLGVILAGGEKLETTLLAYDDDALQLQEYGTNRIFFVYRRALAAMWVDDPAALQPPTGELADLGPGTEGLGGRGGIVRGRIE